MAEGHIKSGTELGRGVMRDISSLLDEHGKWLVMAIGAVLFLTGAYCYSRYARFDGHSGFMAIWKFAVTYRWHIAGGTALAAVAGIITLFINAYFAKIVSAWLASLTALYVCAFGTYVIFASLFGWSSRSDIIFLALYYPLAGVFWQFLAVAAVALLLYGLSFVDEKGPTLPVSTIFYLILGIVLFAGINYASERVASALQSYENMGLWGAVMALAIVAIITASHAFGQKYSASLGRVTKTATIIGAFVYLSRCVFSILDVILASVIGYIGISYQRTIWRIVLIFALYVIPSLVAWWSVSRPLIPFIEIHLDPLIVLAWMMAIPCAVTLGIYRRSAWLDDIRRSSLMASRQGRTNIRIVGDLQIELLTCGYLLFFVALPTTLYVLNSVFDFLVFPDKTAPDLFQLLGWVSDQMVKDISVVRSLGEAVNHHANERLTQQKGPPIDFYVRLLAEVTVVAAILQTLTRNGSDAQQREQFEDANSSADRLDILAEPELFRSAFQSWPLVVGMPRYDARRLRQIVARAQGYAYEENVAEIYGAGRVSGYQIAIDALQAIVSFGARREPSLPLATLNQDFRSLAYNRDYVGQRWSSSDTFRASDPRKICANEALAGLQARFKELQALRPAADLTFHALSNVGLGAASSDALDVELRELKRKSDMYDALRALDTVAKKRNAGYEMYQAASGLDALVIAADKEICQEWAKDEKTPWLEDRGIALLGALPEDEDNEKTLLSKLNAPRTSRRAWNSLAKTGTQRTIDRVKTLLENRQPLGAGFDLVVFSLTAISLRKQLGGDVTQILRTLLTIEYPGSARFNALRGLYFHYDQALDEDLILCASHGYVGPEFRDDIAKKKEERQTLEIKLLAIYILKRFSKSQRVLQALIRMRDSSASNQAHLPPARKFANFIRYAIHRIFSDYGAPWHVAEDDYDDNKKLAEALKDAVQYMEQSIAQAQPNAIDGRLEPGDAPGDAIEELLARVFLSEPQGTH